MPAFLLALTLASAPATPSFQTKILDGPPKACVQHAEKATNGAGPPPYERLDTLPAGHAVLTVLRTEDGCPVLEVRYRGQSYFVQPPAQADSGKAKPIPLDR
jgi:hypothetical protein